MNKEISFPDIEESAVFVMPRTRNLPIYHSAHQQVFGNSSAAELWVARTDADLPFYKTNGVPHNLLAVIDAPAAANMDLPPLEVVNWLRRTMDGVLRVTLNVDIEHSYTRRMQTDYYGGQLPQIDQTYFDPAGPQKLITLVSNEFPEIQIIGSIAQSLHHQLVEVMSDFKTYLENPESKFSQPISLI